MRRGRVQSGKFKLGVIRQGASGEKRLAQVCREHRIAEGPPLQLRREYEARRKVTFPPHAPSEASRPRKTPS